MKNLLKNSNPFRNYWEGDSVVRLNSVKVNAFWNLRSIRLGLFDFKYSIEDSFDVLYHRISNIN